MRNLLPCIVLACLLPCGHLRAASEPANPVPVPPEPFDLKTCYELAVLRSDTLGMKEEDIRIAQARYWQAFSGVLPKIHYTTSESIQNMAAGGSSSSGSSSSSTVSAASKDKLSTGFNVTQPIFRGLREWSAASAAKADIEARKQDKQRYYQLLYQDVSDVFYQILMYEGDLLIFYKVEKSLNERLAELDRRVRLGKSLLSEMLMTQTDLAGIQATIEGVRGSIGASREIMAFLTGVPASQFKLKDTQPFPTSDALEKYLVESGERPDILAAIQSERSATKLLSAAKGEHWPTLSATGNYYMKQHPDRGLDWDLALVCDMPLFEGGLIEAKVTEQKARLQQSHLSLDQTRRNTDKDVRVAYNNFISSSVQYVRLREATAIAAKNYEVQQQDYRIGAASNLDVLEALKQKYLMERSLLDAEMAARADLIGLHVAAGVIK
ncbi:MAG: TolC family protein [Verrucomicrobiae bacterium]|nr:TolC family protein [Verrucomicrobiae bacterium]